MSSQPQRPKGLGTNHRHTTSAVLLAVMTALCGFGIQAQAAITTSIGDKAGFLAATGATSATGPLPNLGGFFAVTVGSVTFASTNSADPIFIGAGNVQIPGGDWYPPTPGNDLAINGVENMNVTFAGPVYSMGFDFVEPDATMPFWGGIPVDSTFEVTLKSGATTVDTFQFNTPDDVITFVGVWSDTAFNRVEIREISGTNDDEYFGEFYTGTTPLSALQPVAVDYSAIGAFRDTEPLDGNFDDGVYANDANTAWFPVHRSTTSSDAARTAFEFNISGLDINASAILSVPYSFAINSPSVELHGFEGNGVVTRSDVLFDNLLGSANLPDSFNGPLMTIEFDVTPYLRSLLASGAEYIGFSMRIAGDLASDTTSVTNVWSGRIEHDPSGLLPGPQLLVSQAVTIAIDIKPGSDQNPINPRSKGVTPVAILTTDTFDATTVDPMTVSFGPAGAMIGQRSVGIEDVDGDGDLDLILHFLTQETGIACGDTSATLTGKTLDGTSVEGSASIATVSCN